MNDGTVFGTTFDKVCTKQAEFFASLPWPWSVTAFLGGGGVTCRGWKVVVGIAGIAALLVRLELVRLVGREDRNPNLSPSVIETKVSIGFHLHAWKCLSESDPSCRSLWNSSLWWMLCIYFVSQGDLVCLKPAWVGDAAAAVPWIS